MISTEGGCIESCVSLCACVKGAQLNQFDWPKTLRSQVSNYDISVDSGIVIKHQRQTITLTKPLLIPQERNRHTST